MSGLANVLLAGITGFVPVLAVENTNIGGYQETYHVMDYNRLRADLSLEHEHYANLFGKLIIDNENLYTERPAGLQNKTSIYRAYMQYRGRKNFWSIGKQRIPLGVGRIWNPIDVFNPINIEQIEPDEREGTDSIRYEYALSDLSNFDITVAKGKGAGRLKGFLEYADVALVGEWDDEGDLDIIGWELEGELLGSGIELRSEGGSFHDRSSGERYTRYIAGAEYGFAGSLTLLAEYNYRGDTGYDYLGGQASYQPDMLWLCYFLMVTNLDDQSGFIAPSVEYSMSDDMTLSAGAFIYFGGNDTEFGPVPNRYYLRWFVHF